MRSACYALTVVFACSAAVAATPDGEALYQENCSVCHGAGGMGGSAPKLAGDASEWKLALFERAVLGGTDDHGKPLKAPMPHWQGSSFKSDNGAAPNKAEIDAIQHYLHQQKK